MPKLTEPAITVEELQREIDRLRNEFDSRLKVLERRAAVSVAPAPPVAKPAPPPKAKEPVSPEIIAIIAAAVTSFLGKKVKLHHVHLLDTGTSPWAQQGRAIIQASHNLVR